MLFRSVSLLHDTKGYFVIVDHQQPRRKFRRSNEYIDKPEKLVALAKLQTYYAQLLGKFLHRLQSLPDGDGSLLEHSRIFFGSGMSNSNVHSGDGLPFVVVGGARGTSRHVQLPERTPLANIWLTVADRYNIPLESFGMSTGRVEL